MHLTATTYKGFIVVYNPKPIPASCGVDWDWYHPDIDLDDPRHGNEASIEACFDAIDEWIAEHGDTH